MRHRFLLILLPVGLSACAGQPAPQPIETTGMASPELALQRSITATTGELRALGTMRPSPPPETLAQNVLPDDVTKRVWFAWDGPLNGAVKKLGHDIGYTVAITGKSRSIKVQTDTVSRVIDILHTLGDQAGSLATVAVDPLHHMITVIYHA